MYRNIRLIKILIQLENFEKSLNLSLLFSKQRWQQCGEKYKIFASEKFYKVINSKQTNTKKTGNYWEG